MNFYPGDAPPVPPDKEPRCYTCDRTIDPQQWRYVVVPRQVVCAPCWVRLSPARR